MALAWTDEFEVDESEHFVEEEEEEDFTAVSRAATCHGVHSWLEWESPARLIRRSWNLHRVLESQPEPHAQPACEHESHGNLASHGRLWVLIEALEDTIRELDEAPSPQAVDVNPAAKRLRESVLRLTRLEQALPSSLDAHDNFSAQPIIDWRAVNRDQARGAPEEILSEDGAPLIQTRISHFDVYIEESDAEEPLID